MWRGWWRWWRAFAAPKRLRPRRRGRRESQTARSGRRRRPGDAVRPSAGVSGRGLKTQTRRMSRRWTSCPAAFEVKGRKVRARMCNVSKSGAQIRLDGDDSDVQIKVGSLLELTIRTPYGEVTRQGVVKWSREKDECRYFGVDFGELPHADPLSALADSPF